MRVESCSKKFWRYKMRDEERRNGIPLKKRWIISHFYDNTCWFLSDFLPSPLLKIFSIPLQKCQYGRQNRPPGEKMFLFLQIWPILSQQSQLDRVQDRITGALRLQRPRIEWKVFLHKVPFEHWYLPPLPPPLLF